MRNDGSRLREYRGQSVGCVANADIRSATICACMRRNRPAPFRGRPFQGEIILLCVRWYVTLPFGTADDKPIAASG